MTDLRAEYEELRVSVERLRIVAVMVVSLPSLCRKEPDSWEEDFRCESIPIRLGFELQLETEIFLRPGTN